MADKTKPLDAERASLRSSGYSEAEISQILIARAVGGQSHPAGAQGALSNVLSSIVAIGGHARALVPTFRSDFTVIFSRTAPVGARIGSTFTLMLKLAVIAVLAYAGWQEWQQHIISATTIAASEARKRQAEECSARAKAIEDVLLPTEINMAREKLRVECDPDGVARRQQCDRNLKKLLDDIDHWDISDPDGKSGIEHRIATHSDTSCSMVRREKNEAERHLAAYLTRAKPPSKDAEQRELARQYAEVKDLHDKGNFPFAFSAAQKLGDAAESFETKQGGTVGPVTANALVLLAWEGLFAQRYADSLVAAERSIKLNPRNLLPIVMQAHALMFLGRDQQAKAIYLAHKNDVLRDKPWKLAIAEDFAALRSANLKRPLMEDVQAALSR
jgi:hypothetical protein